MLLPGVKTGYIFAGWSDGAENYNVGDYYPPKSDITLYAIWQERLYTVTFDDNEADGGTIYPESITQQYVNEELSLPENPNIYKIKDKDAPNSEYFVFSGWSKDKTSDDAVSNPYTPDSDITLFAIWK